MAKESGALSVLPLEDKEEAARVWKIRGMLVKGVEAVSEQEPLDIVVPINQIDAFVNFVNAFEKECGMRMISFGHAGDGNVHLCVVRGDRDDETWEKEIDANLTVLYDKAYALGWSGQRRARHRTEQAEISAESIKAGKHCIDEACESSF